jgi:hypothetical protein
LQAFYPAAFEREVGCTEAEWLMWLPAAIGVRPWQRSARSVHVAIDDGKLVLLWHELPPRQIALVRLPRLAVSFRFEGVDDAVRHAFMKRFDLYMQRGGG